MASLAWENTTKMLPSDRDPGTCRKGDPRRPAADPKAGPGGATPAAGLAWLLALPPEGSLKAAAAHPRVQQSLAAWESEHPCIEFMNEKSELHFLAQRSIWKEEGSMAGQTSLCGLCIGVY